MFALLRSKFYGIALAVPFFVVGSVVDLQAAPFDRFRDCDVCPEMIELPLGEFMMGAPEGESQQQVHFSNGSWQRVTPENPYIAYHEGPVHRVEIDVPFAMGVNEVTFEEWMACVADGGCNGYIPDPTELVLLDDGQIHEAEAVGRHPVRRVSFVDALSYLSWLNQKLGVNAYRLPTEAEWEYAARAGTQTAFAQGDWVTPDQVNFNGETTAENLNIPDLGYVSRWMPVPVDRLDAANLWGLRHMSGNIGEMTMSCWSPRHLGLATSSAYLEAAEGAASCAYNMRKGGDYGLLMDGSRLGARTKFGRETRVKMLGFRVVQQLPDR